VRDPGIIPDLEKVLEGEVGGDPMNERRWVRCSLSYISKNLEKAGHQACPHTVRDLLKRLGFSLKGQVPPDPDQLKDGTVACAT
jgi:hypothetical protein